MSLLRTAIARVGRVQIPAQAVRQQSLSSPRVARAFVPKLQQTRSYASKKKSKHAESTEDTQSDAFVPGSQRIAGGEVYFKAEESMKNTLEHFRKEVSGLETRASGRVTTGLLAPVRVKLPGHDSKGVRLEEVATVGIRDGTTLIVTVFEEHVSIFVKAFCMLPHAESSRL